MRTTTDPKTRQIAIRFSVEDEKALRWWSRTEGVPMGDIVRRLVRQEVARRKRAEKRG